MDRRWDSSGSVLGYSPVLGWSCTNSVCLLHIWNKEASLGLPLVFTALLFFHTPRKILLKHTFQTHQLNMGEKIYYIFPL